MAPSHLPTSIGLHTNTERQIHTALVHMPSMYPLPTRRMRGTGSRRPNGLICNCKREQHGLLVALRRDASSLGFPWNRFYAQFLDLHTKKRLMETLKIEKWKAEISQQKKSILGCEHGGKFALLMKYKREWEPWKEMKWINDDFKNKHVLNVGTTSSFYSTAERNMIRQMTQHKVCVDWRQDGIVPGIR